jgi:hypothetical protein
MNTIHAWNPPVEKIKSWILEANSTIGSVWFIKKSNGELRKMCYRLHVKSPSVAKTPKGITPITTKSINSQLICAKCGKTKAVNSNDIKQGECQTGPFIVKPIIDTKPKIDKKRVDEANDNITVLDCNAVVRDENGKIKGRGAWKSIPLKNITRIKTKGKETIIVRE